MLRHGYVEEEDALAFACVCCGDASVFLSEPSHLGGVHTAAASLAKAVFVARVEKPHSEHDLF